MCTNSHHILAYLHAYPFTFVPNSIKKEAKNSLSHTHKQTAVVVALATATESASTVTAPTAAPVVVAAATTTTTIRSMFPTSAVSMVSAT